MDNMHSTATLCMSDMTWPRMEEHLQKIAEQIAEANQLKREQNKQMGDLIWNIQDLNRTLQLIAMRLKK